MSSTSDLHTYTLRLSGALDDDFLAGYCPEGAELIVEGDTFILAHLHADQAGLLGIIRSLHNLGLTILEMSISVERISQ
jgi:hypothetical protein